MREGTKHKEESKEKMRGKNNPMWGIRGLKHPSWGSKHSEETKRKMRENHADFRREKSACFGKSPSVEAIEKMRQARIEWHQNNLHPRGMLGKQHKEKIKKQISNSLRGEKNPNWHNGIRSLPYSWEFNRKLKSKIRERDDYTCQFCGAVVGYCDGRNHPVHHIDYDKENFKELNFITLCATCNSKANHDRDKWQFYFEVIQELRLTKCQ